MTIRRGASVALALGGTLRAIGWHAQSPSDGRGLLKQIPRHFVVTRPFCSPRPSFLRDVPPTGSASVTELMSHEFLGRTDEQLGTIVLHINGKGRARFRSGDLRAVIPQAGCACGRLPCCSGMNRDRNLASASAIQCKRVAGGGTTRRRAFDKVKRPERGCRMLGGISVSATGGEF